MPNSNVPGRCPEERTRSREPISAARAIDGDDAVDLLEDPAHDGPFAFASAIASGAPRISAEAILWTIGVVLVLAGSLYFTRSNWSAWSAPVRAAVVTIGLVFYQGLFVALGAFLAARRAPRLPVLVLAGLGAALAPMIGWAAATVLPHAWPVAVVGIVAASALSWVSLHTMARDTRWTTLAAALAVVALTFCRAPSWLACLGAAFAFAGAAHAILVALKNPRDRIATSMFATYLALTVVVGLASHPLLHPLWVIPPALGVVAVVVHRGGRIVESTSSLPRILVIAFASLATAMNAVAPLGPVAGRVAMLVTASLATYALFSRARWDQRRLPIALALVSGLLVYFFIPAPFRVVMDALLAGAKSALGYDDRPLPIAYYGLTFIPYLGAWWLGSARLGRLDRTVRGVLFVLAIGLTGISFAEWSDARPALMTMPVYIAAFIVDARRRGGWIATNVACAMIVLVFGRAASVWLGADGWPLGVALAGLVFAARPHHRIDASLTLHTIGASAVAVIGTVWQLVFWRLDVGLAAAVFAVGAANLIWVASRSNQVGLAWVGLSVAVAAAWIASGSDAQLVLTIAAVLTAAIALMTASQRLAAAARKLEEPTGRTQPDSGPSASQPLAAAARKLEEPTGRTQPDSGPLRTGRRSCTNAVGEAARNLSPILAHAALAVGLVEGASAGILAIAVAVGLMAPRFTRQRYWMLPGALGAVALAGVVGPQLGWPSTTAALLAAVVLTSVSHHRRASRYRTPLRIGVVLTIGYSVLSMAGAGAPILGFQIAVMVAALLVRRKRIVTAAWPAAVRIAPMVVAFASLVVADRLAIASYAIAPAAVFVLLTTAAGARRAFWMKIAAGAAFAVVLSCVSSALEVGLVCAVAGPLAFAVGRRGVERLRDAWPFGVVGAVLIVGAAVTLDTPALGLAALAAMSAAFATSVGEHHRRHELRALFDVCAPWLSLAAMPLLAFAWSTDPSVTAICVAPALVVMASPLVHGRAVYVLLAGIGTAAVAIAISAWTPMSVAACLTAATALFTVVARRSDLLDLRTADAVRIHGFTQIVVAALAAAALLALFTHPDIAIADHRWHACFVGSWAALLLALVFIATGIQLAYAATLMAMIYAVSPGMYWVFDHLDDSLSGGAAFLWSVTSLTAIAAVLSGAHHRSFPTTNVLRRSPSAWVPTALALALLSAGAVAMLALRANSRDPLSLVAVGLTATAFVLARLHHNKLTETFALIALALAGVHIGFDVFGLPGAAIGAALAALAMHTVGGPVPHRTVVAYVSISAALTLTRLTTHGFATAAVLAGLTAMLATTYKDRPRRDLLVLTALSAAATTSWLWFGVGRAVSVGRPELAILPFVASGFVLVAALLGLVARFWIPEAAVDDDQADTHFFRPIRQTRFALMVAAIVACGGHVAFMVAPSVSEISAVALVLVVAAVFFARSARANGRTIDAIFVESTLFLGWMFLRRECAFLAGVGHVDAFAMMIAAFGFTGVHALVRRGAISVAYGKAARVSAMLLPMLSAVLFEPDISWRTAGVVAAASVAYAVAARARVSRIAAPLATFALNGATLVAWWTAGVSDPQLYALPVGASLLFLAHLYRDELSGPATAWIRLVALGGVYLSSFVSVLAFDAPSHSLVMACIAVGGAVLGVFLRVRSYLLLGAAFLFVDLGTAIVRFGLSGQTAATFVLTALGLTLLAALVVWSLNRASITKMVEALGLELAEWEM